MLAAECAPLDIPGLVGAQQRHPCRCLCELSLARYACSASRLMGSARRRAESQQPGIRIHAPVVVRHIAPGEADAAVVTAPARACVEPVARRAATGGTHSDEHMDVRGAARAGAGTTASPTDDPLHFRRSAMD
ncbi:MAG: hypothetical protein AMXMBFR8_22380 [Nevskiales bacterium]